MVLGFFCAGSIQAFSTSRMKQIVVFDEAPVGHLALKVGEAFDDERRLDAPGRQLGQAVFFKFVDCAAGRIADLHHFARQFARRNGDHGGEPRVTASAPTVNRLRR